MKARIIILFCMLITATKLFSQSVSINTTGIASDTSAILDIASSSKGFLMPRMTQAQRLAIVLPADGLLVFQTDGVKGFYYYHNSSGWTLLASSSGVISTLNGLASVSQSFGTPGTSGTSPNWSSSGSVHTLNIPMSGTSGVTAGLLSNTDWNIFNNKLSTTTGWTTTGNTGSLAGTNFIGTTDAVDFVTKTNNTERMRVLSGGNVGIGTTAPGSALDVKGTLRLSGSTSGYVGLAPAAAAGSTTYTLPAADGSSGQQLTTNGSGTLSWSNQTGATSVSNTSSANNLSTTVNGVTGSNVSMINSISNTSSANNLSTTVNGVAGSNVAMVNSISNTSSANNLTTTVNGVAAAAVPMVNSISNTSSTNSLTTTVNGVAGSSVNIININATSLSGSNLTTTVNGVAATALDLTPAISAATTHAVGTAGTNILTSTVNGVSDTALAVNTVSNSISTNSLTTTVNGVAGSALDLSAGLWSKTGNSGTVAVANFIGTTDAIDFVAKTNNTERFRIASGGNVGINTTGPTTKLHVNGNARITTMASGLDTDSLMTVSSTGVINKRTVANVLAGGTNTLTSAVNTITSTVNGVAATASAVNSVSNTSSANNLSTTVNGVTGSNVTMVNSISNTSSANNLTTTVNGVAATAVPMVNSISNTSSTNSLTTTVNGVSGSSVNIINSNATSLSGNNLTTTVNGVAATVLDISPVVTANAWSKTGNSGTTAGTNFVGTTDAVDFVTKTNNTEKVRVTSGGNVGIGTNAPTQKLSLDGTAAQTMWMERHTTANTAGNNLTVQSGGATSGATDKNGGSLNISSGTATGSGSSNIYLQTATAGSSGTTDRAPSTKMSILGSGNVGINTTTPGSTLDVKGTLRLSGSTSGYVGLTPTAAAGSTTYTLPAADGTSGQALLTNGSGVLSWGANKCSLGTMGAGFTIPGTATGTYYCTGSNITLPPGKYIVSVNMMLAASTTPMTQTTANQAGSFFIKSFFADVSFGTVAGTTMSPVLPATNVTADIVGNAKLISGSISVGQPYNPLSGFVVINNTSGANKTYYYWMGWVLVTNINSTNSLSLVGGTNYGEDNIVAFPAN